MAASLAHQSRTVLLISRSVNHRLRDTRSAVEQVFHKTEIRTCVDVADVAPLVAPDRGTPDLVIVHQDWPGQYSDNDVRELLALLPLARWVCVLGSWCEGDGRNGSPWPIAVCVRERETHLRIVQECEVLVGNAAALPLTASRDEVFAFSRHTLHDSVVKEKSNSRPQILVLTNDREWRLAIEDLLRAEGFRTAQTPTPVTEIDAIVWDADPLTSFGNRPQLRRDAGLRLAKPDPLENIQNAHPQVPIVAAATMPYPHDVERLVECGAITVVEKSQLAETITPVIRLAIDHDGVLSP